MKWVNTVFSSTGLLLAITSIAWIHASLAWTNGAFFVALASSLGWMVDFIQRKVQRGGQNQGSLQSLYETFEVIMGAARTLYGQSENLKKIVVQENQSVESSSSAVDEISSMLGKAAANSTALAEAAKKSLATAENSERLVQDLSNKMHEIEKSSTELENTVKQSLGDLQKVVDAMNTINSKTTIINDIVFQTKLLSFNASVEAARAGDAGKGFAVVAEEIGNLATMSGAASHEINEILNTSVKGTSELIHNISDRLQKLTSTMARNLASTFQTSNEIVHQFESLCEIARETSRMSLEISHAAGQQDIGVREVSSSLHHLSSSSQTLSQVAETTFKTSFELSNQTDELKLRFVKLSQELGMAVKHKEQVFDFNAAIQAHIDWRMKLDKYMAAPNGSLKPETVGVDNGCALGKWIYGDGSSYRDSNQALYENLRESHASFHRTAADIIRLIDAGKMDEAKKVMSITGPYSNISEETVKLLRSLKDRIEGKRSSAGGSRAA